MKFKLYKASDYCNVPHKEIEINSLEDLQKLSEHYRENYTGNNAESWMKNCAIQIDFVEMEIVIYDDWME